jgi:beta-lactamase regulating signal transducer with metallopeptidase domain
MSLFLDFHGVATAVSQRLLFSAVGGTLLVLAVWFLLQLFPKRDSRTNFAIWFSTLLATALLPILSLHPAGNPVASRGSHALLTVSTSGAWYMFVAWAVFALAGLARVVAATFQVRRLRSESALINMDTLHVGLRGLMEEAQRSRPISLLVSEGLEVPTAIGFRNPAVILPAWMLETTPIEELKYVLLHELAHLRRRDDWTNLAQKILKALLFFLPSVWWMERRLSLEREMACDDAVLARSGSPREYAECLARVAERSFLRRQLALAQAAVGRVWQLTERVTMILDPDRPRATQLGKAVVPLVVVLAGLSAFPASFTSELVGFADDAAMAQAQPAKVIPAIEKETAQAEVGNDNSAGPTVRLVPANLSSSEIPSVAQKAVLPSRARAGHPRRLLARKESKPAILAALNQPPIEEQYVTVREEVFFVVTERTASGEQQSWQMHIWQVSVQPQSKIQQKPRKI